MLFSIVPIVVALGLLFSVPVGLSGVGLFAYATVTLFALRISISLFQVPYLAWAPSSRTTTPSAPPSSPARVLFTIIGQAGRSRSWRSASSSPVRTAA